MAITATLDNRTGVSPARLFAIIGHPVGQARSPAVFNDRFRRAGIDATMIAMDLPPDDFAEALAGLRRIANLGGLIVTIPHKQRAAQIADMVSERVARTGAANILRPGADGPWEAELFDGVGLVSGLARHNHHVSGRHVAVVGSGGAGRAIAEALLQQGAAVDLSDIDEKSAHQAVDRLSGDAPAPIGIAPPGPRHDIVVNATPVGMGADRRLPFSLDRLRAGAVVAEAVMVPPVTTLLREAEARGHPIVPGRCMLDGQIGPIWRFLGMGGPESDAP